MTSKEFADKQRAAPPPRMMTSEEFVEKETKMLSGIPEELHSGLAYHAWEQGHSAGYSEVLIYLSDLVNAVEEPLRLYTARILKEANQTKETSK